ncbi:acyl-CoA dehydrogenase [Pseudorhizobium endolithicum]|uniref:Acyl-CoA dehydrogenase n=1 Tax=Pseudorhizobium endolithicum TaxID=1191678 RepID=A0ABM8PV21_9HYPH|nr:acyl-CoA dehydrogenase family protein [Pseudorhizobium endolithicum]CAD7050029.1 acyl-CoA dehydrogenase [Pseudorhizobium endolithicum]
MSFADQVERTLAALAATPGWRLLQQARPDCDDGTVAEILEQAAGFSERVLAPINRVGDRHGARLLNGRVKTPDGFRDAFRGYAEAGWLAMDLPDRYGGQELPLTVQAACAPLFERGCVALMMAAGASRAAAHLLAEIADEQLAGEWVPKLAAGEWAATICVSESDAGSDVGRIRTSAEQRDGRWQISGQKTWISFGDHDLTERIGHCLLARTGTEPGVRGLSLFLVPDTVDGSSNGITVDRIEDKMGLQGSPTCALRFEKSRGWLVGAEGRGLPQLFRMIELMRLQTACQGLGLASASVDIAERYAQERRQGGDPEQPAVPISGHPDVRRQLSAMRSRTEVLQLAVLELASAMDLARLEISPDRRREIDAYCAWMLPLIKNFGGEAGFDVANAAIQVLGGAGYTRDWPLEQYLRDARVMTIYEGTTGMQALDFLTRRLWRDGGSGCKAFLAKARSELASLRDRHPQEVGDALDVLDEFEAFAELMMSLRDRPEEAFWRADEYLGSGWAALSAWLTVRWTGQGGGYPDGMGSLRM